MTLKPRIPSPGVSAAMLAVGAAAGAGVNTLLAGVAKIMLDNADVLNTIDLATLTTGASGMLLTRLILEDRDSGPVESEPPLNKNNSK